VTRFGYLGIRTPKKEFHRRLRMLLPTSNLYSRIVVIFRERNKKCDECIQVIVAE